MHSGKYSLRPHPRFGFLQVTPTPSVDEIARFYADEFYSSDYPRLNDSSLEVQLEDKEFYDAHREDMCATIASIAGRPLTSMRVLDIGCGWGQALQYFRSKGMGCYGFDPAPEAVEYGKKLGLNLVHAGLERMDVFGQRFDVVTLLNVVEHLADPVAVLEEIKREVLEPGGIVVIDVPNEFSDFQIAGQLTHALPEWWVSPPGHLNYFSNTTLTSLLTGTGYEVKYSESSFPLEMFLLMGRKYVGDPVLGKTCHKERVAFETNLRRHGRGEKLRAFYRALAGLDLGRQVVAYAINADERGA